MNTARLADPYSDLTVIDSRAPRFNQAVIGVVAVLAVATGWWWLLAALAANLALGLTFGRRFCVTCVAYFAVVQPLVGEGPLEDRPSPERLELNDLAVVRLRLAEPLVVDTYESNPPTGAFILVDEASNDTVAAGMVLEAS